MFQPGWARLALGHVDGSLSLWDMVKGQHVLTLKGHKKAVHSLCFSPDGQLLASAGDDGTVVVWDASGEESSPHFPGYDKMP